MHMGENVRRGPQGSLFATEISRRSGILAGGRVRFGRSACDSAVSDVEAQCVRDEADVLEPGPESASQRASAGGRGPIAKGPACSFGHGDFQSQEGSCP